jgi:hypothetical protein
LELETALPKELLSMEYRRINDQETLELFLNELYGFHDALIREVAVCSRGYVDHAGLMWGDVEPSDARIIIHSQFERCRVVELVLNEIQEFRLQPWLTLRAEGEVAKQRVEIYPSGAEFKIESIISAKVITYRVLAPEAAGNKLNIISPIPIF